MKNRFKVTAITITNLEPDEIFVFGDNEAGIHGAGAAKTALNKFGAVWGKHDSLQGSSYGISTKDKNLKVLPLNKIQLKVNKFIECAKNHPNKIFLVTLIGCGLAGYKPKDIAPLFKNAVDLDNVYLPIEFLIEL